MATLRQKGFTLIELIIAITILAILAVGLLAALDPVEQLTKARETTARETVNTIAGAYERFYATNEVYDTQGTSLGLNALNDYAGTVANDGSGSTTNQVEASIVLLQSVGEVKSNFVTANASNLSKIFIYKKPVTINGVSVGTPVICTKVQSKAFSAQRDLWTMVGQRPPTSVVEALNNVMPFYGAISGISVDCSQPGPSARTNCAYCLEVHK